VNISPTPDATANEPVFRFGTKAETLERLAPMLKHVRLCDQIITTVAEWRRSEHDVIERIVARFASRPLAIRSSSTQEDGAQTSNAGRFESVTNVAPLAGAIGDAIERVIGSYGQTGDDQQVLIQPMVEELSLAGVVLTRDLETGSPYYVIDYDDFSGRTDTITSGAVSKMVLVHRSNPSALHSPRIRAIIDAVREIEQVTGSERLDIEFCLTPDFEVIVLQVRALAADQRWQKLDDSQINGAIADVRRQVRSLQKPVPGLVGATTIFGEMPDWNPAEMIGTTPRRLAGSLYRRLITDRIWATARTAMGYRDVETPLMLNFAGRPYIDVRASLNSFLPAEIGDDLADRIVNIALDRLAEFPQHHDKIEFEIAITCRDLDFDESVARFADAGLSSQDIAEWKDALTALTARHLSNGAASVGQLVEKPRALLLQTDAPASEDRLVRVRELLDRTATDGTLPFSMLARHAFIGMSFLRSLVASGAFSRADADKFMRSISTIAADVVNAMAAVANGQQTQSDFLSRYGHLRPGTYDILSWRYDERPELYLGHTFRAAPEQEPFQLGSDQRRAIDLAMANAGFETSAEELLDYIAAGLAAREEAKFAFSCGISDALAHLSKWGEDNGLSRQDISHLSIDEILGGENAKDNLPAQIADGKAAHALARALRFPHLIVEPDDLDVVRPLRGQPTFITNQTVTANGIALTRNEVVDLTGVIVLIGSADPGYDWIFSHNIAGLITEHGGANSHMAIRCAEFGLPAAIGCGERLFRELTSAQVIELNAANRTVRGH
jgi:glutamine kinase